MVGSALQHARNGSEEKAGEVVETTRSEREETVARLLRRKAEGGNVRSTPGVDSGTVDTTEGRSLDNPKRGREW